MPEAEELSRLAKVKPRGCSAAVEPPSLSRADAKHSWPTQNPPAETPVHRAPIPVSPVTTAWRQGIAKCELGKRSEVGVTPVSAGLRCSWRSQPPQRL